MKYGIVILYIFMVIRVEKWYNQRNKKGSLSRMLVVSIKIWEVVKTFEIIIDILAEIVDFFIDLWINKTINRKKSE